MLMTEKEAIELIKTECYIFNALDLDKSTIVNSALDVAVAALEKRKPRRPCT